MRGLRTERAPRRLAACAGPPPHRGGAGFDNARIRGMTGHDYTPTANKSKNIFPAIPPNHPKRHRLGVGRERRFPPPFPLPDDKIINRRGDPAGRPLIRNKLNCMVYSRIARIFPMPGRPNTVEKKVSGRFVNRPYMLGYGISLAIAEVSLGDNGGIEENTARRKESVCRGNSRIARRSPPRRFFRHPPPQKRGLAARIPSYARTLFSPFSPPSKNTNYRPAPAFPQYPF